MSRKIFAWAALSLLGLGSRAETAENSLKRMEQECREIVSKMTVEEKISQLMYEAAGIERLGIKPYNWWGDALHGVSRNGKATMFPEPIAMASSFDEELMYQIGEATSLEARAKFRLTQAKNNHRAATGITIWEPNINIFRDPRWGRGMETWGEDPFLTGKMASALIRGMQGEDPVYLRTAACAKHFAVHSGPEATRHSADVTPSKRDLYETYLPAFEMLIKEGKAEIVMSAYNALYGASCSGSKMLLTDILRKEWGFEGHIVSDCGAISDIWKGHKIVKTAAEAAAVALKSGLNMECGDTFKALPEALEKGLVSEKDIDNALMPLMMTRIRLGILHEDKNCPYNEIDESVVCSEKHTAISREAARECMVLLKNDNDALPLDKNLTRIAMVGPAATDIFYQMGNYYGVSPHFSTYLEGITSKVSNGTTLTYTQGFNAYYPNENPLDWSTADAAWTQATIIFMGINGNLEGEEGESISSNNYGDRKDIELPESQLKYFRTLAEKKKRSHCKLITVVCGGSPLDLREIAEGSDAVVMAWYSGQEGGEALGDLLFGDAGFSGRLPITFPETAEALPPFDDYSMKGRTYKYMTDNIFYPFGYGLTYGKIEYSKAEVSLKGKLVTVTAEVSNQGLRECDEVAQVYLSTPTAGTASPIASLVAFERINLQPGEKKSVTFTLKQDDLKTVQEDGRKKLLKGEYQIRIGGAAPSTRTEQLGISHASTTFKI